MAVLDREREVIVIRVVYDGPPEAGKTHGVPVRLIIIGSQAGRRGMEAQGPDGPQGSSRFSLRVYDPFAVNFKNF